ncbi:MAG: bifunctional glutamate N-acetyltransferase/amino-acid acetyltransferase ArgJ [Casimicrobiaceae bacterium]|nr:bifunctional glutamate N-acetyltransferase/amino-acid acetyltransferase ArgJ [Casimicrobiaceae bacterium]
MPVAYQPLSAQEAHTIAGVTCYAVQAGIRKANRYDFLVVELAPGAGVGAVFTQNRFAAAPVLVCREHLARSRAIRALVVNTGVANAATGERGLSDARHTCQLVAQALAVDRDAVLPFSTGVILEHLPVERIERGVALVQAMRERGESSPWDLAARAIMTTDTVHKLASRRVRVAGREVHVTGIAKGAGMIQPNMATMLGFVFTDAAIAPELMQPLARELAQASFNRITVDGDTSTNDSFVVVATGAAHHAPVCDWHSEAGQAVKSALESVSLELAQAIVRDGEGASKFITIRVTGGRDVAECDCIARAVAHSPLVKTAFFASDPNLGRILAAVGNGAPADLDPSRVSVRLNGVLVAEGGGRAASYREELGVAAMKAQEIEVEIALGRGAAEAVVYTCDLSYDYVKINADYRS